MQILVVTDGRIDGNFEGWSGNTRFRFTNGQVWEQAVYKYRYHYAFMPRAKILSDGGRFLLEIDGINERLPVRRVF